MLRYSKSYMRAGLCALMLRQAHHDMPSFIARIVDSSDLLRLNWRMGEAPFIYRER